MARPVETTLFYFPLDCKFFINEKVKALRRAHGTIGVLTYIFILCKVYDSGYYYRVKNLDSFAHDIAESIANKQLDSVAARVRESIDYMADSADLLDRSCLNMGILTSKSIQEQYSDTMAKFKRKSRIKEYNLLTPIEHMQESAVNSEETRVNSEETEVNSEITHRKGKGNKEYSLTRVKETPTLEEIEAYCWERHNTVNPQRFYDYYTANGWMVGKNPMQDWQAAIRRWETNGVDNSKTSEKAPQGIVYEKYSEEYLNGLFDDVTEDGD